ncbi:hypothetical protein IFM89_031322 [Coptis chinensis]|uniref:CWF19-like protein 2 n=1 Tax=Coptis chinensis TaxID=261450 RepID=A0A835IW18_9MAGN|nr:hypothetical protein IFM89_031322 [Coptis chinensis]
MLSGVKFIPRDQLTTDINSSSKGRNKADSGNDNSRKNIDNFDGVEKALRRKTMGLEWMLIPEGTQVEEKQAEFDKIKQDSVSNIANDEAKGTASKYAATGDEYDFDYGTSRKRNRTTGGPELLENKSNTNKHILTQQMRCQFCFENPTRPRHLVVAISNCTYLMLPQWQPVVQGHCCILPLQHESGTRNVDNSVWNEIRNFKKCLIKMFTKQKKEVVFLETVIGLSQQHRHCLVECVPLPRDLASEAPLYFKKAIDEAEEEWSQHNAKKLIDTSVKGLHGSIPKDFPYFHVEFGLHKGFVHVIDDENQFKSSFGLNVIRGMLQLPQEDNRLRKHESFEAQRKRVLSFAQEWEPFDWTKELD